MAAWGRRGEAVTAGNADSQVSNKQLRLAAHSGPGSPGLPRVPGSLRLLFPWPPGAGTPPTQTSMCRDLRARAAPRVRDLETDLGHSHGPPGPPPPQADPRFPRCTDTNTESWKISKGAKYSLGKSLSDEGCIKNRYSWASPLFGRTAARSRLWRGPVSASAGGTRPPL